MFHQLRSLGLCSATLLWLLNAPHSQAQSHPKLAVQIQAGLPTLSIAGDAGSPCIVQYATNLNGPWVTLANYTLPANTGQVVDPLGATNAQRFYRSLIVPPTHFAWLAAGAFLMGSPTNEVDRASTETQHTVVLTKGFYTGQFLVTQTNYTTLLHTNPSFFTGDPFRPVEQVSWSDATNYCAQLTQQERAAGRIFANWAYRLPTEAEWEYACRAGTTNTFYYGTNLLSGMANFDGRYEYFAGSGNVFNINGVLLNRTTAVGGYTPNNAGLYDMVGNLWEWCADWFAAYPTGTVTNPPGPATGTARVFRGGTFNSPGSDCRSAKRNSTQPDTSVITIGFRLVLSGP